jgi:transcriptional regulator with XRE-family HTH domain
MADDTSEKARSPRGLEANGELMLFLRLCHNLTQEQAASMAGVSDKLIRKAESSGRIQPSSIRALASIYQQPYPFLILPREEPTQLDPSPETQASLTKLRDFIRETWSVRLQSYATVNIGEDVVCHCEEGELRGRERWIRRMQHRRKHFANSIIVMDQIAADRKTASCKWRGFFENPSASNGVDLLQGTTTIRIEQERIAEIWEFSAPQLPGQPDGDRESR